MPATLLYSYQVLLVGARLAGTAAWPHRGIAGWLVADLLAGPHLSTQGDA